MRILFICGSFEPGRDGVGDYTRRLGQELLLLGHDIAVSAIHDSHIKEIIEEQGFLPSTLSVQRLPSVLMEKERFSLLKQFIEVFNPDWLSLQYVPFSYHPKGLCFSLPAQLAAAGKGRKWEIMFHEICVGMHEGASLKLQLWGILQKHIAKGLLKKLNPALVHTHTEVYQKQLEKFKARVSRLPLFSNIPLIYAEEVTRKLENGHTTNDENTIDLLIFASIQEGAPIEELAAEAKSVQEQQGISLRLLIIGRSGKEQENWVSNWKAVGLASVQLGEQSEENISKLMAKATFGIFTTPMILAGKSGAVAAMREHGIQLLCVARKWEARGIKVKGSPYPIMEYKAGNLADFLVSVADFSDLPTAHNVAGQFDKELLTN